MFYQVSEIYSYLIVDIGLLALLTVNFLEAYTIILQS